MSLLLHYPFSPLHGEMASLEEREEVLSSCCQSSVQFALLLHFLTDLAHELTQVAKELAKNKR